MDRRSHYLASALALFTEHGYPGVSMDAIVEAAGGSKATLYRHFDSKEALFEAIIDDVASKLTPPGMPAGYLDLPLEQGLRILGHATAAGALSQQAAVLTRLASAEVNRFPNLAKLLYDRGPALTYQRFGHYLEHKERQGEIALNLDRQIAAEQFISSIVGHQQLRMQLAIGTPTKSEIEARVEAATATFITTYATPSPRVNDLGKRPPRGDRVTRV